jgi:hypothetical protein
VMAAMYLPSGDHRGEKSPLEPGKVETCMDLRSMVSRLLPACWLLAQKDRVCERKLAF